MKGQLIQDSFQGRQVDIYLPPSCRGDEKAKHSVVYLQDGGDLFLPFSDGDQPLDQLEEMADRGEMAPLILVGVTSKSREMEYTPWPAKALVPGRAGFGGEGRNYLTFLTRELKPWLDKRYPTRSAMAETGIAGASLGGLIAIYAAYLYPEVFGRIGSVSGSMWYPDFLTFMESGTLTKLGQKIYLDVGSREGLIKTTAQREMVPANHQAYRILRDKGLGKADCQLVIDEGAIHGLPFFRKRLPNALRWLFGVGTSSAEGF